jgi:hypothetical protein
MYRALQEMGLDGKYEPQDYLNFFCLGNREAEETPSTSSGSFSASNPQVSETASSNHVPCCNIVFFLKEHAHLKHETYVSFLPQKKCAFSGSI